MPSDPASHTKNKGSRFLALIPVSVAVLLGALLLPRSAPPRDIPLPEVDQQVVDHVRDEDHARAERVRAHPLSGDARELGSAIRDFNMREAKDEKARTIVAARDAISAVLPRALLAGVDDLIALRSFQLEAFLDEVRAFERTGKESEELAALGGTFVFRMRSAGWCVGHDVVLSDDERRVAFKLTWNGVAGVEQNPQFALTLDEMRVLYTLYLRAPHMAEASKRVLDSARAEAKDKDACAALSTGEKVSIEAWRYDKVKKLGAIDPKYPLAYALGVSHFLRGQYPASAESFRDWLRDHPHGPLALRASNYLKAAIEAASY